MVALYCSWNWITLPQFRGYGENFSQGSLGHIKISFRNKIALGRISSTMSCIHAGVWPRASRRSKIGNIPIVTIAI
jgi:hypothetical protein